MSQSDTGLKGIWMFSLGGVILVYVLYSILENVNKYWIDEGMFVVFFILPLSLGAFLLLGYGLLSIVKSGKR